jgi:hypothetical protein
METTKRDITTTIDTVNQTLTLVFANGREITVNTKLLSPEIIAYAMLHGLKQKLVDAAAISRDPETGRTADINDKFMAVSEIYRRLLDGEWNKRRESGEPRGGLLFAALCRLYPTKTPDSLREWLAGKTKSEQSQLRGNPKIAAIIDEIRAESTKNIDTDGLLSELDD